MCLPAFATELLFLPERFYFLADGKMAGPKGYSPLDSNCYCTYFYDITLCG